MKRIGVADGVALFEPLVVGGDEAIVAMAPQLVFGFVEGFFGRLSGLGKTRPGCSMGILIAHQQYPIRDFVAGAEELLRKAKEKEGDAVDYAVLTQSMTHGVAVERSRREDGVTITGKPYAPKEFVELRGRLVALKSDVALSRLRDLARLARKPKEQAELEYCYLLQRSGESERVALLREFGAWPWKRDADDQWRTDVPDLMEMWRVAE
jgi:hypothetical protein